MKPQVLLASGLAAGWLAIAAPSQAGTLHIGVVLTGGGYDHGHRGDAYRIGYERGRNDGFEEGVKDARRHDRYDFADEGAYRCGDRGYRHEFGPRHRYAAGFREGFEQGYRRGYRSAWPGRRDWRDRDDRYGRDWRDHRDGDDRYRDDRDDDRDDRRDNDDRRCDPRYGRCER